MPYALYYGSNRFSTKRKKERLTDEVSILRFVCKPFLFCSYNYPSVAYFSLSDAFQTCGNGNK